MEPGPATLQAQSYLAMLATPARNEVRTELCKGHSVLITRFGDGLKLTARVLATDARDLSACARLAPELVLGVLLDVEAAGKNVGGWPQYLEALWESIASPEEQALLDDNAGYDDLVLHLVAACTRRPGGLSRLSNCAAEIAGRNDFAADFAASDVCLWSLDSLLSGALQSDSLLRTDAERLYADGLSNIPRQE